MSHCPECGRRLALWPGGLKAFCGRRVRRSQDIRRVFLCVGKRPVNYGSLRYYAPGFDPDDVTGGNGHG
jgi:hypothetical protein